MLTNKYRCCIITTEWGQKHSKEVKMTKQRAVILEVLRSDKCHHTAEEIFELARLKLPGISLATVYNNLRAL